MPAVDSMMKASAKRQGCDSTARDTIARELRGGVATAMAR